MWGADCDFWIGHLGETLGAFHGRTYPAESVWVGGYNTTTPTYFNCIPKACWVSGKLKNWSVIKEMHAESEEGSKQVAFFETEHNKHVYWSNCRLRSIKKKKSKLWLPWASKNSSSELSSESRAMLCILHSEMLWRDGLTKRPHGQKKKIIVILGHVL